MCSIPDVPRIASAAAVYCGPRGAVSRLAVQRGVHRQILYREAQAVARTLDPCGPPQELAELRQRVADLQAECDQLRARLAQAILPDPDKQAEFAATAQALGVSLSATRTLLAIWFGPATPSIAKLGRLTRAAGRRAGALLAVLDVFSGARATQIAADEIFSGRKPILMTVEQDSLCWLGGRLTDNRDGATWAEELRRLPAAEQVTADGGLGIRKGLACVNDERCQDGPPPSGASAITSTPCSARDARCGRPVSRQRGPWPRRSVPRPLPIRLVMRGYRARRCKDGS